MVDSYQSLFKVNNRKCKVEAGGSMDEEEDDEDEQPPFNSFGFQDDEEIVDENGSSVKEFVGIAAGGSQ